MIVACIYCKARVDGKEIGVVVAKDWECPPDSCRVSLLQCPVCRKPLVAEQGWAGEEELEWPENEARTIWSAPRRVWPAPELSIAPSIPKPIRNSLIESRKCLMAGAYTASVAMTGRALEAIGRHFHTQGKADKLMLGAGIRELYENKIIDERLYTWSQELHQNRNLAAHASDQEFDHDDADDLLNFATAICDYVFVLNEKFARFQQRTAERSKKETSLLAEPSNEMA